MKIGWNNGIKHSLGIIPLVRRHLSKVDDTILVGTFDNCREQGLVLTVYSNKKPFNNLHIAICEHRCSDNICIWVYSECLFPYHLFAEGKGEWAQHFSYKKGDEAAEWIARLIKRFKRTNKIPKEGEVKCVDTGLS